VRRAFLLAIDRSRALAFEPENRRLPTGILPPGLPGYSPVPRVPMQDRDEAIRLLAAAGHPNGRGLPELELWVSEPGEMRRCLNQLLVADLRQVGIRARIREVRWCDFDSLLAAGAMPMFSLSWMADLPDPDAIFLPLFHSRGSCNFFGYSNPEVDRLLEAARGEPSSPRRYELFRQAEEHILADAPVVPLDHLVTCYAVRKRVHGLRMNPMGLSQLHLREIWVEPAPAGTASASLAD
jgi:ABC-type transport system substrate-binding protein